MILLTAQQMKQAEKTASQQGLSYSRMMDNAGSSAAKWIHQQFPMVEQEKTVVLCGNGNNGGDGFVVARRFAQKGFSVSVVLLNGTPESVSAMEMASRLQEYGVTVVDAKTQWSFAKKMLEECALIVDAIFGTGFHGQLPGTVRQAFAYVNRLEKPVVALDLPSGVTADTGAVADDTLRCAGTVTFHSYKYAHVLYPARELCGTVWNADIGIDKPQEGLPFVIERPWVVERLKRPKDNTHKGSFGTAGLFVGSEGMAGAALFAIRACLRCGVGLARPIVPNSIYPLVASGAPEGVYTLYDQTVSAGIVANECMKATACLVGCGSKKTPFTRDVVLELISSYTAPLVIDADGINSIHSHIDRLKERKGETVLTPHPGEMARLLGKTIEQVQENRIETAQSFAKEYGVIVVLKGAGTVIAGSHGELAVSLTGNSGLSKGGSGDVLAGMITSFLAQGMDAFQSACVGVWLHGLAGEITSQKLSRRGMLPSDVIECLPDLFLELESE
ncbi:MAG: NAD(P)H-hydrate dehydratase [Clostridia bacterium]|nr:NAD(P)H-hydrate dehydratase [Clostridia bacterium]